MYPPVWARQRWRCWGESGGGRSGQHGETEPAKVFVEGQTGHMIQERCDDDERDRVTERQAMIPSIMSENLLGFIPYTGRHRR